MSATIWSGVIGFGMVSIPVKLFAATSSKRVAFHQLHAQCQTRIKEVRWCPTCDREVPWEEIVKGYAISKDEFIPMTDEDFDKLPIPSKNIIDVTSFVRAEEVDSLYFEKNYYLLPEKQGTRAFNLFVTALASKSLLAIGKITIRSRERLCSIRTLGNTLILTTLLYQDEIKVETAPDEPGAKVPKQELDMALSLIDLMSAPFDPAGYKDDYKEALEKMLEMKTHGATAGKTRKLKPKAVVDLMEALKASVSKAGVSSARAAAGKSKATVKVKPKTATKSRAKAKSRK
ncbi:MAG: Ku protein [Cyanobacteria bacterium SZAS LIN-3]|nr:Ku protein [Cyanobacteria bacterium SZAS LIN-3]